MKSIFCLFEYLICVSFKYLFSYFRTFCYFSFFCNFSTVCFFFG